MTTFRRSMYPLLLLLAATCPAVAQAQSLTPDRALSEVQLDAVRGGFDTGTGLLGSFGIDRVTYINGQLAAHTSAFVPDIAHVTTQQASALAGAMRAGVIQNGPGNVADPASFSTAPGALVVQNSLDNQNIQNLTNIRTSVNTLPTFHALSLQDALQSGITQSLTH